MIISIDGLKLPPTADDPPYLINRDVQRQTVSGRLITKLDLVEKWVVPVAFKSVALTLEFQAQFYAKCLSMRSTAAEVVFISPYDGETRTIIAKCISRTAPKPFNVSFRAPEFYTAAKATFQEV